MVTKQYGSKVTERMISVCKSWEKSSWVTLSLTDRYDLPPEHRVKPNPLDVTGRAKQWHGSATSKLTFSSKRQGALYCYGTWHAQYWTWYQYTAPHAYAALTTDYPDSWAKAIRLKIQDDKISFAETIGEWRESLGLLSSAEKTLRRSAKLARQLLSKRKRRRALSRWFRGQFGRSPRDKLQLMDAVQLDLAIKFGIKPTADLLYDSIQALKIVRARDRRIQVTVPDVYYNELKGTYGGALVTTGRRTSRCIVRVRYKEDSSNFTAGNLAESIWAGIPISFVFDWFVDVGGYLESFNGLHGVNLVSASVSHREELEYEDSRLPGMAFNGSQGYTILTPGKGKYKSFERQKLTTLPFADLPTFKLPDTDLWERLHTLNEIFVSLRRRS